MYYLDMALIITHNACFIVSHLDSDLEQYKLCVLFCLMLLITWEKMAMSLVMFVSAE